MQTLEIVAKAREALSAITGKNPEVVSRCEKQGDTWVAHVEVMEMKARLTDNDQLASYMVSLDDKGDVVSFERVRQYVRAKGH